MKIQLLLKWFYIDAFVVCACGSQKSDEFAQNLITFETTCVVKIMKFERRNSN